MASLLRVIPAYILSVLILGNVVTSSTGQKVRFQIDAAAPVKFMTFEHADEGHGTMRGQSLGSSRSGRRSLVRSEAARLQVQDEAGLQSEVHIAPSQAELGSVKHAARVRDTNMQSAQDQSLQANLTACDWSKAPVYPNLRCSPPLWSERDLTLSEAKSLCEADNDCSAIMRHHDPESAWFHGCAEKRAAVPSTDWDLLAKPGECRASEDSQPEWTVAVAVGPTAQSIALDVGKGPFNELFAACPVLRYVRNGHVHSVYVRKSALGSFNAYATFVEQWSEANNLLHGDFEIFDNFKDANEGRGAWDFCDYDVPGVGYPAHCGEDGAAGEVWFSLPTQGRRMQSVSTGARLEIFSGDACVSPVGQASHHDEDRGASNAQASIHDCRMPQGKSPSSHEIGAWLDCLRRNCVDATQCQLLGMQSASCRTNLADISDLAYSGHDKLIKEALCPSECDTCLQTPVDRNIDDKARGLDCLWREPPTEGTSCSFVLWRFEGSDRSDAQARCEADSRCTGIAWQAGSNAHSWQRVYEGCKGLKLAEDWHLQVKPECFETEQAEHVSEGPRAPPGPRGPRGPAGPPGPRSETAVTMPMFICGMLLSWATSAALLWFLRTKRGSGQLLDVSTEERRADPCDNGSGDLYTYAEFVTEYGEVDGARHWEEAGHAQEGAHDL